MKGTKLALAGAALSVAWCGSAWADDAKTEALEKEVLELRKQVADLARRVGDGSNRSDDELEQRIAELEKVTKKDQDGLFGYWKTGTKLDSVDGDFKVQVFGRLQNDWVFWDSEERVTDRLGETSAGTLFRRARLGVGGTMYKNVIYKYEMDFAGGSAANWADAFIEIKDPSCGAANFLSGLRVGHFDEPMGLDRLTSSKYGTFMERGLPEAFTPQRNTGIMAYGPIPGLAEGRMNWYFGYFRDANGNGDDLPTNAGDFPATPSGSAGGRATAEATDNDNRGEHNWTMRLAGRPWVNADDASQWLHVGAALSMRNPSDESVRYSARPEIRHAPTFIDTGTLRGIDSVTLVGLEAGANFGPFHAAAEYIHSDLEGSSQQNVGTLFVPTDFEDQSFDAFSIQAGYFLTGETREYDAPNARWDRIKVKKNFGKDGTGAWEVALRYSHMDLNDGDLTGAFDVPSGKFDAGGELTDWTLGLNWYLNPNTRIMLNFIHANRQGLPAINAVGVRFAVDF